MHFPRSVHSSTIALSNFASPRPPGTMGFGSFVGGDDGDGNGGEGGGTPGAPTKETDWSSLIGIVTAIVGNMLIALALNVQRYAHMRLHRKRALIRQRAKQALRNAQKGGGTAGTGQGVNGGVYGTTGRPGTPTRTAANGGILSRRSTGGSDHHSSPETEPLTRGVNGGESGARTEDEADASSCSDSDSGRHGEDHVASTYLQDPYWWLGQVLITVGEMGNFLAYGFAPASIVSPLGVVALVSNCVIAPIFFKEVFRPRDFWGVVVAVAGAVTVVLSAKQKETKLEPHDVWDAITTMEFEVYMTISCSLIVLLMWLSPRYGNRTILIDLGLVGLFGGYTALSTKGVSSMLSSTFLGAFTTPVTYVLVFVLLSTAVLQVRYVNKALQRFDSTQVIPIQFVLFTLSVIIGSAVLYRDFERTTSEQAVKFIGGCLLTFFGVFLITSGRPRHDEDEETLSDEEGVEETINLSEQGPSTPQAPQQPSSRRGSESARSRRSSRASRVSFKDAVSNKPLSILVDTGIPSQRAPGPSQPKTSFMEGGEDSPLLANPWREGTPAPPQHPGLGSQMPSTESVVSFVSTVPDEAASLPGTPLYQVEPAPPRVLGPALPIHPTPTERPMTPRTPASRPHSHHYSEVMISPSPFSSTVTAVVADKLLSHIDSPTIRRMASRRSRPSLRSSLFVPADEVVENGGQYHDEDSDLEAQGHVPYSDGEDPDDLLPLPGEGPSASSDRPGHRTLRGRAQSLSNTLGDFFGVKRKRRNTFSDRSEDGNGGGANGRQGHGTRTRPPRAAQSRSTETL